METNTEDIPKFVDMSIDFLVNASRKEPDNETLGMVRDICLCAESYNSAKNSETRKKLNRLETYLNSYLLVNKIDRGVLTSRELEARTTGLHDFIYSVKKYLVIPLAALGLIALCVPERQQDSLYRTVTTEYQRLANAFSSGVTLQSDDHLYRVVKGDTLSEISHKVTGRYGNWRNIQRYNNLKSDRIEVDQILRIPKSLIWH